LLKIISKDEKSRMLYESRQSEISDQRTRINSAEARGLEQGLEQRIEQGIEQGIVRKSIEAANNLLKLGFSEDIIVSSIGLPIEKVRELKKLI